MSSHRPTMIKGFATAASPLFDDLLLSDSRPVEPALLAEGNHEPAGDPIPKSRYFDPEFAALEREYVWKRQWQIACRLEDIPEVGDRVNYDVGEQSYLIVRTGPDSVAGFYNSCLHRGTKLCTGQASGDTIRCPFHAWEWSLDGGLLKIPSRWDFPHVKDEAYRLSEVQVGVWGGNVFINPDLSAGPLSDALGVIPEHFEPFHHDRRITVVHVRKKVRANWKVLIEAFLEAYHVVETHADALPFTGDASTEYEIWDDGKMHISRLVTPLGVPSAHLGDSLSARDAATGILMAFSMALPPELRPDPSKFETLGRKEVAEWRRQTLGAALGRDFSNASDAHMIDSAQYYMFPNYGPWICEGLPLQYQFLPYGADPETSVLDVRLMVPGPDVGDLPPAPQVIELDFDEPFSSVEALGFVAHVFGQDMANLPNIQLGLKAAPDGLPNITLGRYQERRIQHLHESLMKVIAEGQAEAAAKA